VASAAPAVASAPVEDLPAEARAHRVVKAKMDRFGARKGDDPPDSEILKAYADNELAADKEFKGRPHGLVGILSQVSREEGRIVALLDTIGDDPKERLAVHLRKVRLYVDKDDGASVDMLTELKPGAGVIAECNNGLGADDEFVTFEGCSIWCPPEKKTSSPSASSSSSAPVKK
jgi:hypothetical protein